MISRTTFRNAGARRRPWLPLLAAALTTACAGGAAGPVGSGAPDPMPAEPADTTFQRHSVLPLPAVFYTPETRWAGGGAALHAYRSSAAGRPVATSLSLIRTQNRQTVAGVGTDAYLRDGRVHASVNAGYSRFPASLYGIGNTPSDDAEAYTPSTLTLQGLAELRVAPGLYLGMDSELSRARILEMEAGGLLAGDRIAGSGGGRLVGVGGVVTRDTRDNTIAARSGSYGRLRLRRYATGLGSDYGFTRADLDLRAFHGLGGGHVLAGQVVGAATTGDVPFYRLPGLGGQNLLRGYYEGRYRDGQMLAAQVEYRTPTWRRLGLVAFAGAGQVAGSASDFTLSGFHGAAGAGLRIVLSQQERMALRFDYGVGAGGAGTYITVGEAF